MSFHDAPCKPAAGKDIKKELNACSVIFDLPADNALRKQLSEMKATLEAFVDKTLDLVMSFVFTLQPHKYVFFGEVSPEIFLERVTIFSHRSGHGLKSGSIPAMMRPSMVSWRTRRAR